MISLDHRECMDGVHFPEHFTTLSAEKIHTYYTGLLHLDNVEEKTSLLSYPAKGTYPARYIADVSFLSRHSRMNHLMQYTLYLLWFAAEQLTEEQVWECVRSVEDCGKKERSRIRKLMRAVAIFLCNPGNLQIIMPRLTSFKHFSEVPLKYLTSQRIADLAEELVTNNETHTCKMLVALFKEEDPSAPPLLDEMEEETEPAMPLTRSQRVRTTREIPLNATVTNELIQVNKKKAKRKHFKGNVEYAARRCEGAAHHSTCTHFLTVSQIVRAHLDSIQSAKADSLTFQYTEVGIDGWTLTVLPNPLLTQYEVIIFGAQLPVALIFHAVIRFFCSHVSSDVPNALCRHIYTFESGKLSAVNHINYSSSLQCFLHSEKSSYFGVQFTKGSCYVHLQDLDACILDWERGESKSRVQRNKPCTRFIDNILQRIGGKKIDWHIGA
jgi:hypothetical protein